MYDLIHIAHQILERGETLSPRDCILYPAFLTLACYIVLLLSGRFR